MKRYMKTFEIKPIEPPECPLEIARVNNIFR